MISIIVAAAQNLAIGKDNDLLWHISDDLKRFKSLTSGHPVIMGRRTFDSLPKKPLPKRRNIVLTHDQSFLYDGVEVAHSVEEVMGMVGPDEEAFVMGGAAVYRAFMSHAEKLYVTWVYRDFEADTFLPPIDEALFELTAVGPRQLDEESGLWFAYAEYRRRK